MKEKRYSIYQIILAYLLSRYQAYREDWLFKDTSSNEFVMLVCTAKVGEI